MLVCNVLDKVDDFRSFFLSRTLENRVMAENDLGGRDCCSATTWISRVRNMPLAFFDLC